MNGSDVQDSYRALCTFLVSAILLSDSSVPKEDITKIKVRHCPLSIFNKSGETLSVEVLYSCARGLQAAVNAVNRTAASETDSQHGRLDCTLKRLDHAFDPQRYHLSSTQYILLGYASTS